MLRVAFALVCATAASGCAVSLTPATTPAGEPSHGGGHEIGAHGRDHEAFHREDPTEFHPGHRHGGTHPPRPPFGFDLGGHWDDPYEHTHLSSCGTPQIHGILTEPAFLGRDLFLDAALRDGEGGREFELEAELEWALTRRVGLIFGGRAALLDPDEASSQDGFGDTAVGVRLLMAETERFILSAGLELELPTGDETRGLGAGEVIVAPSASWWADLGWWVTWQGKAAVEILTESSETELAWSTTLAKSFCAPFLGAPPHHEGDHGFVSLLAEVAGVTGLSGAEEGETTAELLLGFSYLFTDTLEVHGGYIRSLSGEQDYDGLILGMIIHF